MLDFNSLAQQCASDIHPVTIRAVVRTESGFNPYALGVVGGRLVRQPRNREEAVATAEALDARGINFSIGLGQVNKRNLARYRLTYETAFDPCANLRAASAILHYCYQRATASMGPGTAALRAAISCYYSGNFVRGERSDFVGTSYVQRVIANAQLTPATTDVVPAIPVVMDHSAAAMPQVSGVEKRTTSAAQPSDPATSDTPHPSWDAFGDFDCDGDSCR